MKKETIEEAAERYAEVWLNNIAFTKELFIDGAKWQQEQNGLRLKHSEALLSNCEKTLEKKIQQERSYSEEEVKNLTELFLSYYFKSDKDFNDCFNELFKQFKKK